MFARARAFLAPPTFETDDQNHVARILNVILLAVTALLAVLLMWRLAAGLWTLATPNTYVISGIVVSLLAVWVILHRGHLRVASIATVVFTWLGVGYITWNAGGISDSGYIAYLVVIMIAGLSLGWREALLTAVLTIVAGWALAFLEMQGLLLPQRDSATEIMVNLTIIFTMISVLLYLLVSNLQNALEQARQTNLDLHVFSEQLDERVQARTQELVLAAEVAQNVSTIRNLGSLLTTATELIQTAFNLYYVQVYLLDESGEYLELRAGTGEAAQTLIAQQHRLPVDGRSINSTTFTSKQPTVVADTAKSDIFQPNPLLPETRSEMAVPLLLDDTVVGVLNLQSSVPEGLTHDSLPAFQTIAGQLAVAIRNARLFAERRQAAAELVPFRLGFERSASAIFMTDVDGIITYVNPSFTRIYGYSEKEALGRNPRLIKSGLIPREQYAQFWQTLLSNEAVVGEIINRHKDGRLVYVASNNVSIVDDAGHVVGFLAMQADITEQKRAQAALDRSVAELNCLNEIGRKAEEAPLSEFLTWITALVPTVMAQPETCIAAVTLGDEVYGDAAALTASRQMVEGLRAGGEQVGRLYMAYSDDSLTFADEDSAFIGGVGRRIGSYIEGQKLLQTLEQQATDLQTVAQIGTAVAAIRDPQQLLQTFVDLTREQFELYHTQLFQFDAEEEMLRLVAGTGTAGDQMVVQAQPISLHQQRSLVARAARSDTGVIVNDVEADPDFLPHPLLPETRAEMAIPIIVFGELRGVLDLQSAGTGAFAETDLSIFTTLAAQLGIAMENAFQYAQTQETLAEVTALQRAMTGEGWRAYLTAREKQVYGFATADADVRPIVKSTAAEQDDVLLLESVQEDETAVVAPVALGDTTIAALGVRAAGKSLTDEQKLLLDAISAQVAQALERARLAEQTRLALNETEARTEELALLNEMSQELTAQTSVDGVLDVVYKFTSRLMAAEEFYVALYYGETDEVEFAFTVSQEKTHRYSERRKAGQGITEYMIRQRRPLLMPDRVDERLAELGIAAYGRMAESWLGAPMMLGARVIGVIGMQSYTSPRVYSEQDLQLLTAIASQAAIAIENARLIEATEERALAEQMLREVTTRVSMGIDAESILLAAAEEIGRTMGLEGTIFLGSGDAGSGARATNGNSD